MALQAPSRRRCTGEGSRSEPVVVLEPHFIPVTTEDGRRPLVALADLLADLFTQSRSDWEEEQ